MTQPKASAHPMYTEAARSRQDLRKSLLQKRRDIAVNIRQQWDRQLAEKLLQCCQQQQITSLAVYWPIRGEPDLQAAYAALSETGLQLALPLVLAKQQPLQFLAWRPGDPMLADEYGIPVPAQRTQFIQPAALLIPCVGFNAGRYRLGYGGGYYDRTLEKTPRPLTIGIAYQCTQADFAADTHDIPMDIVITEA
ncbi:5-formyltetrahydrofolate cyclo-ligase [Undibacterium sp. Di26W]|uniref:5-formyltetrahydrofolate cyclo-ligase n=1 Tax=Undibacterium sp. Di26W TaxID=3413035 RepID=UPI003BF1E240